MYITCSFCCFYWFTECTCVVVGALQTRDDDDDDDDGDKDDETGTKIGQSNNYLQTCINVKANDARYSLHKGKEAGFV